MSENTDPPAQLAQGSIFGDFMLIAHLSDTKSGSVWRGKHQGDGRLVTLKLLPREAAKSKSVLERFEREARLCARLSHPHVISGGAPEAALAAGIHYLVLENVEGVEDLAAVVARGGPLAVQQAVDYVRQAAEGLAYLHEQKIYHRNVKPANLVRDKQGVVRVANLLTARLDDAAEEGGQGGILTHTGEMLGTVDYMAPEQADDAHAADHRADIYALGCTLFQLLMGRPPYPEQTVIKKLMAHKQQPVPSLRTLRPDVPEPLDRLFQRMVAKQPDQRCQSMAEVVAALRGGPLSPPAAAQPVPLPAPAAAQPARPVVQVAAPSSTPAAAPSRPPAVAPATIPPARPAAVNWTPLIIGLTIGAGLLALAIIVALVAWLL